MNEQLLSRSSKVTPPSFVRGILKAAECDEIISFAGGLPNPISFPQQELKESMNRVVDVYKDKVFQYAATAGLPQLRAYIADKYSRREGMEVSLDDIIITTGSQQALDLISKVLIDPKDPIVVEEPGYLGALQCFSQYEPEFCAVKLTEQGIDVDQLETVLRTKHPKVLYVVPNYQNPSGLTYTEECRSRLRKLLPQYDTIVVEDDPYGELSFEGKINGYVTSGNPMNSIFLGSFSKIISPGIRLGFMIIKDPTLRKYINTAKEAADLHSCMLSQYVIWDYLTHNDVETHISQIRKLYKSQCESMIRAMERELPDEVTFTRPKGGMFIWATLPEDIIAMELFEKAKKEHVAFVPGNPFYADGRQANTMRLNYTNASTEMIEEGMKRLGRIIKASI